MRRIYLKGNGVSLKILFKVFLSIMNIFPLMECLLNDLLMGKTPDGQAAKIPGFTIIGTQNPPTRAGRARPSLALQRRLQTVTLPEYSDKEMIQILSEKGLPAPIAEEMTKQYRDINQNAQSEHDSLCFRDLIKRAEQEIQALGRTPKAATAVIKPELQALSPKQERISRLPQSKAFRIFPAKYDKIMQSPASTNVDRAFDLLNDYTKGNSAKRRFFSGQLYC